MIWILNTITIVNSRLSNNGAWLSGLPLIIISLFLYIKKNKYGFSPKDFREITININFKNKYNIKKFKRYLRTNDLLNTFAIVFVFAVYVQMFIIGFGSYIDISNYHNLFGDKLSFNSLGYWTIENAYIGNPSFSYKLDFFGIFDVSVTLGTIFFWSIGFYFTWKLVDINFWKNEYWFESYENKWNSSSNKNIKRYKIALLVLLLIINISLLIAALLPLEKPDVEYYIVNFNKEVDKDYYGFRIYSVEIGTIVLTFISLACLIAYFVVLYKIDDLTCIRYEETIIRIFKSDSPNNCEEVISIDSNNNLDKKLISKKRS